MFSGCRLVKKQRSRRYASEKLLVWLSPWLIYTQLFHRGDPIDNPEQVWYWKGYTLLTTLLFITCPPPPPNIRPIYLLQSHFQLIPTLQCVETVLCKLLLTFQPDVRTKAIVRELCCKWHVIGVFRRGGGHVMNSLVVGNAWPFQHPTCPGLSMDWSSYFLDKNTILRFSKKYLSIMHAD